MEGIIFDNEEELEVIEAFCLKIYKIELRLYNERLKTNKRSDS